MALTIFPKNKRRRFLSHILHLGCIFSEASSRPEGGSASSETIVSSWVRDAEAGEGSVVV